MDFHVTPEIVLGGIYKFIGRSGNNREIAIIHLRKILTNGRIIVDYSMVETVDGNPAIHRNADLDYKIFDSFITERLEDSEWLLIELMGGIVNEN